MTLKNAHKCPQESRPGACYKSNGGNWDCWREGDDKWGSECVEKGFEGACTYPNHGKTITSADQLQTCSALGECSSKCKETDWGACYVKDKSGVPDHKQCLCVPTSNKF